MAIGKPLLVDQGRKEQGTVLSAQTTPLSTQVAVQKLSFADYGIGQANAKASFAVTDELVNMAETVGKAAIFIDKTKKEHARLDMMQGWQEADDKFAEEFASAITYGEKTEVARKMQESIGARAKNYQNVGGSSIEAKKSLAALTNASRSSLSKMNISSAQRLVTETNTGFDLEEKRISSVIANDPTADMGVYFEKYRKLQDSRVAANLLTRSQAEFQQMLFQRTAHANRGKLLGDKYADAYINGGTPLPDDGSFVKEYEKNTNLDLDDIQKDILKDSVHDIYTKKLRQFNAIEEAEVKAIRLQNREQKDKTFNELGLAYVKGDATPEKIKQAMKMAESFGDPFFTAKINKMITEEAYGYADQNVLGSFTSDDQRERYTGKAFMQHGVFNLKAISESLPSSANSKTKTEILKFYSGLNDKLGLKFSRKLPNMASAALEGLLGGENGDPAFREAFRNFDYALYSQMSVPTFRNAINFKEVISSHSKFAPVYNGVMSKVEELAINEKGLFSDDYLAKNGPETKAEEVQALIGRMFKEDIQKVVDEENRKVNADLDMKAAQDLVIKQSELKKKRALKQERLKDEQDIKRGNIEKLKAYEAQQIKNNYFRRYYEEDGKLPLVQGILDTTSTIGQALDDLFTPIGEDINTIAEAMGKGIVLLDKSIESGIHSIVNSTSLRVSEEMREGRRKQFERINPPEAAPVTGKGLSEPMTDEKRNQGLLDNLTNISQSEQISQSQAPAAIDQLIEGASQNPIVNQVVKTMGDVLGLGGTAEAATPDATMTLTQSPSQEDDLTRPIHELPSVESISKREATPEEAINAVQDNGKAGGYGHTFTGNERREWGAHPTTTKENIDWRKAKAREWLQADVAKFEGFADNMVQEWETANDATASPLLKGILTRMNYQLGEGWRSKFPSAWKGIMAGSGSGTTPKFRDKTGWEQAIYHLQHKNERSNAKSDWNINTPVRVQDAVLGIKAIAGDQGNSQLKKKEIASPKIKEAVQDKSKIYKYPPAKGKWSKTWKDEAAKLPETPEAEDAIVALDTIESEGKSSMSFDAAKAASKHVMASLFEVAGFDVPKAFTSPINEKTLSKEVVEAGGLIAYKALLEGRPTSYDDMGEASELVDGTKRPKGFAKPLKLMYESLGDAATTFAFTVGESAGIVVKNGDLHIVGDEYNFPNNFNLKGKNAGDGWLMLQKAMAVLSPSGKNRQKIDINLGSLAKIKKRYKTQQRA